MTEPTDYAVEHSDGHITVDRDGNPFGSERSARIAAVVADAGDGCQSCAATSHTHRVVAWTGGAWQLPGSVERSRADRIGMLAFVSVVCGAILAGIYWVLDSVPAGWMRDVSTVLLVIIWIVLAATGVSAALGKARRPR